MPDRRPPASLVWLGMLVASAIASAVVAGAVLYLQARQLSRTQAEAITRGSVARGELAIARYNCGACHVIPGSAGANGRVGPDLTQVAKRAEIAGRFANDPETMVRWLMHPQKLQKGSGMPDLGVTRNDAQDIAAYLYAE